jgi:hypothetical protein
MFDLIITILALTGVATWLAIISILIYIWMNE